MKSYLQLLRDVMEKGEDRLDRTGVGTRGIFGYQWRHKMSDGFPLLTTKKVHFKSVVVELLWFLRGETNVAWLHEHGVTIWDEWADENGDLGPVYGKQWRRWPSNGDKGGRPIDQISNLIKGLNSNPWSRRHIVSAWNPAEVESMALPPCHTLWQCHISNSQHLNLHLYARSIDSFLGLPFNIASYALLLTILGRFTAMTPGELIISFGDLHIYMNHFDQVRTQLDRPPRALPTVKMSPYVENMAAFWELRPNDIELIDYDPHPAIKAPVAV